MTAGYRMISDSLPFLGVNQTLAGSRFFSGTPIGIPLEHQPPSQRPAHMSNTRRVSPSTLTSSSKYRSKWAVASLLYSPSGTETPCSDLFCCRDTAQPSFISLVQASCINGGPNDRSCLGIYSDHPLWVTPDYVQLRHSVKELPETRAWSSERFPDLVPSDTRCLTLG